MALGISGEAVLTNFIISDDCDEACARLKAEFEARDARFNANLKAVFKSPPPPRTAAAQGAKPHAAAGWMLARKSNRPSR
jgi:hypothetical protein